MTALDPQTWHRLLARAPLEDFEKNKQAITAFLDSFNLLPPGNKSQ